MCNKFYGSKLNTILLLILIILLGVAIFVMYQNYDTYIKPFVGGEDQKEETKDFQNPINKKERNCISGEEYSSCGYLSSFEQKSDGYWYLSFDPIYIGQNNDGVITAINKSHSIEKFKLSKNAKVVMGFSDQGKFESFEIYKSHLVKNGGYYWNPTIDKYNSFQHNKIYEMVLDSNNIITEMSEGGGFTQPQGSDK